MRFRSGGALLVLGMLITPTLGGITVTSYTTLAQANGYAPSLQGPYLAEQRLENLSPALAQVSGDWIGPNADGTPATWHFVGTSQASSTTTIGADSYTVTSAASFAYEINTTTDFINPGPSTFTPSGAANYNGLFTTDTFTAYSITAQLDQHGRVRLNSLDGSVVFDHINFTMVPLLVNFSGNIPPGQYRVLLSTSLIATNLPNGVNHYARNGSFENAFFTVQVPEPNSASVLITIFGVAVRRRKGCASAN